jgi:predicted nucleotidyltransferase
MDTTLQYDREALERLCREHHVRRLDLFGSRAKGTDGAGSDVDLLVEFESGHVPGLLGFIRLEQDLADLFGEKVDLISRGGLSPYLRKEILASRSPLYER